MKTVRPVRSASGLLSDPMIDIPWTSWEVTHPSDDRNENLPSVSYEAANTKARRVLVITQRPITDSLFSTSVEVYRTPEEAPRRVPKGGLEPLPEEPERTILWRSVRHHGFNWARQAAPQQALLLGGTLANVKPPPEIAVSPEVFRSFMSTRNMNHTHLIMEKVVSQLALPDGMQVIWWKVPSKGVVLLKNGNTGKLLAMKNQSETVDGAMGVLYSLLKVLDDADHPFLKAHPSYPTAATVDVSGYEDTSLDSRACVARIHDWGDEDRISALRTSLVVKTLNVRKAQTNYRYSVECTIGEYKTSDSEDIKSCDIPDTSRRGYDIQDTSPQTGRRGYDIPQTGRRGYDIPQTGRRDSASPSPTLGFGASDLTPVGMPGTARRGSRFLTKRAVARTEDRPPVLVSEPSIVVQVHYNEPLSRELRAYPITVVPVHVLGDSTTEKELKIQYMQAWWFVKKIHDFHVGNAEPPKRTF